MRKIYWLLVAGLILRLILANFGTLALDQNTFIGWSERLVNIGFGKFYQTWCDYLPGYLYILWFLGIINKVFSFNAVFIYKLPAIISDLFTTLLIFKIVKDIKNEKWALALSSFYLFNPAVLANSTLWGQVDSLTALFSLLSLWLLDKNFVASALFLAYGTSIKPTAVFVAPVIVFLMLQKKWNPLKIVEYGAVSMLIFALTFIPFSGGHNLLFFIFNRLSVTLGQYPYSSVNAFNFWGLFGFWKRDNFGGIFSAQFIGYYISSIIILFFLWQTKRLKFWNLKSFKFLFLAVIFLTSFLFFTRIHERHLLPTFAPLLIASSDAPFILLSYLIFSFTYVLNLNYSFIWIAESFREIYSHFFIDLLIFLNIFCLGLVIYSKKLDFLKNLKLSFKESKVNIFPKVNITKKTTLFFLFVILVFAFISRVLFLGSPSHEYFDEIYHAFTARRMLHGDPKAWEWWNTPPEGFAYEWTHPPLAKEGMVVGMLFFGENSFGWRLPQAILGTLCVFLIFLISKKLFKDSLLGVLSSLVFVLDGLPLVMSRIGMNDIYFLFFMLASFWFFIEKKDFLSAVSLGLAAASKWTVLWFLPILAVAHFSLRKKFSLSYLWFFILPPLIYVASYLPMFIGGHTWSQFIEVQKQMWWYHTRLKATHPYTSAWWSWPFLLRPIWLYTQSYGSKFVGNIYAMGNPIIFWLGIVAVCYSFYLALVHRNRKLGLLVFSYLAFFVPWAVSPRIMFLYHYLPSTPFLAISIAVLLRKKTILIFPFFVVALILFIYFYPHWIGLKIPTSLDKSYYWFSSWR